MEAEHMHALGATEALRVHFGGACKAVDSGWELRNPEVERANGTVSLEVVVWGSLRIEQVHLAIINAAPAGLGVGTEAMEVLAAYCRPRRVGIDLHAFESSASFFSRFAWLREPVAGSRTFVSSW